jgi:hypothetical protein
MRFGLVIGFTEHLQNMTINNYDSLTEICTPNITLTAAHIKSPQSMPGDGFQQCPLLKCSGSYGLATVSQLTHCSNCPAYNISARTAKKTQFLWCCFQLLQRKHACLRSRNSVTAVVYILISRSLPSSRSQYHNIDSCSYNSIL